LDVVIIYISIVSSQPHAIQTMHMFSVHTASLLDLLILHV